jgi:hypothetical protein
VTRSSLNVKESAAIQLKNEDDYSNEFYEVFNDEMLDSTFLIGNDINKDSVELGCIFRFSKWSTFH